jgi:hypothetical protein
MNKIEMLNKLYQKLTEFAKKKSTSAPAFNDVILFLTHITSNNITLSEAEQQYKSSIQLYNNLTNDEIEHVRRLLTAMIDTIQE